MCPREHDAIEDENGKARLRPHGAGSRGASQGGFDRDGAHVIGLRFGSSHHESVRSGITLLGKRSRSACRLFGGPTQEHAP
jgi:hypothetical protein